MLLLSLLGQTVVSYKPCMCFPFLARVSPSFLKTILYEHILLGVLALFLSYGNHKVHGWCNFCFICSVKLFFFFFLSYDFATMHITTDCFQISLLARKRTVFLASSQWATLQVLLRIESRSQKDKVCAHNFLCLMISKE